MKMSIFPLRVCVLLAVLALSAVPVFSQTVDLKNDLRSSFTKVDIVRIDLGGELRSEGANKRLTIQTEGRTFELVVEPNNILSSRYHAEDSSTIGMSPVARPTVQTYKGTIVGETNSEVRLTIDGVNVEGFFQNSGGRRFIEPASRYSSFAETGDSVIYRAEDSLKDNSFYCEADLAGKLDIGREMAETGRTESVSMLRVLELATEADLEYVSKFGGSPAGANNEIISILNMVEGTYNSELNLSISVVYQHTWSAADPFGAANMNGILIAFQNHWNANFGNIGRDAAHLFTGKTAAASQGLAYLGVICRAPTFSYGLSSHISWAPGKFLIPAHELGHNLGADHVDAAQGCANTLMNPGLTNLTPLSFCTFSRNAITAYVSANNSCLADTAIPGGAPFDFDGDGRSDISVFRQTNGVWYLNRSTAGFTSFQFGITGDKAVASDYDGDGRADAAVYRAGVWYRLRSMTNTMDTIGFGLPGDLPVPSDFDGDGKSDVVVFRPSNGVWYSLASSNGAFASTRFGLAGDVPVPGDYDGDGKDDINLYRPVNGTWYRLNSSNGSFYSGNFGLNGDKAVAGDFDGDARSDLAVWRPSNGVWYLMRSTSGFSATAFGLAGDIPAAGDYDGDGKTDISVFRPSNGIWYRLNSINGSFSAVAFGLAADNPIPSFYIQ
jgi:hypothetical protein